MESRPRPEDRLKPPGGELRIDATLAVVLVGFRVLGAGWLTLLGVLSLTGRTKVRAWVVWATMALTWAWTGLTAAALRRRPLLLFKARWLVPDLAVALVVLGAPLLDGAAAINFSGGYPASSVVLWAYVWRYPGALISAGALIAVILVSNEYGTDGKLTTSLVYLAIGLLIPWGVDLMRRNERFRVAAEADLAVERAERIRSQERAEMAARVHDSVLQTLALIQRRAGDPEEMRTLARQQERELRDVLFGTPSADMADSFTAAVKQAAAEVEHRFPVKVDVVTVGDLRMDERIAAVVKAGREALTNAAKFSGVDHISVYSEVTAHRVALFVRDRGAGFDPAAVGPDRRGIADSIVGRMQRAGGEARLVSSPGAGTEVLVALPLEVVDGH